VRSGYAVADINAGLFATVGILMAVYHRDRTGAGQFVDVSMFDSMISAMTSNYMSYLGSGRVPRPMGSAFPTVVPYRVFHASDRVFSLAVGSEKLWLQFCAAIRHPELGSHADYASNALRIQNRHALESKLESIFRERTALEWIAALGKAGIPCSVVRTFDEVVEHPQAAFREMFPWMEHPTAGRHRVTGSPVKMSKTPGTPSTTAPLVGQHTTEALSQLLGLTTGKIERLIADGIIPQPPKDVEGDITPKRPSSPVERS